MMVRSSFTLTPMSDRAREFARSSPVPRTPGEQLRLVRSSVLVHPPRSHIYNCLSGCQNWLFPCAGSVRILEEQTMSLRISELRNNIRSNERSNERNNLRNNLRNNRSTRTTVRSLLISLSICHRFLSRESVYERFSPTRSAFANLNGTNQNLLGIKEVTCS